ncbi:MAG TPA: oligoribonuclease [Buchnera sp. (in: enterobacteria)]|nr:oligoribonuclease [Buchnera sp. (in: enterobacteria)]
MKINKKNLIWIDLEMTGLNPEKNKILEIATIITNCKLKIIDEGPLIPIFQKQKEIKKMKKPILQMHKKNGLIKRVKNSSFNENQAENLTIKFLKKWVPKNMSPMCGNTIAQDRRFLFKYMPKLEQYFHYRYIDVSTIKELMLRWKSKKIKTKKKKTHSALIDIYESIEELKFYRKHFFKF